MAFLDPLDLVLMLSHEHLSSYLLVASVVSLSLGVSLFPCWLAGPSLTWVLCTEPWTLLEGRHGLGHTQMRRPSTDELGFIGGERYFFSTLSSPGQECKEKGHFQAAFWRCYLTSFSPKLIWRRHCCNITVTYICGKLPHSPRRDWWAMSLPHTSGFLGHPPLPKK